MYSIKERLITVVFLLFALLGVANFYVFHQEIYGISYKQIAVLMFIPLAVAVFHIRSRYDK